MYRVKTEYKLSVINALITGLIGALSMRNFHYYQNADYKSVNWAGLILWVTCLASLAPSVQAELDSCNPNDGKVARAMFTTEIVDREPVNRVLILENDKTELHFFTDLRHFEGQTINHRWEYEGQVVMTKSFEVKGPRWRVFSTRILESQQTGRWTVVITDAEDCPLKAVVFRYVPKSDDGEKTAIIDLKN